MSSYSNKPPFTQHVNYFRHTHIFFNLAKMNVSLQNSHVALYWSLMHAWNQAFFSTPFTIHRDEIMLPACISSKATFYRNIRGLENLDLIRYYPAKSKYNTSFCCISFLEHNDGQTTIKVMGLEGLHSITESDNSALVSVDQGRVSLKASYTPVLVKTIVLGEKPVEAPTQEAPYNPLNDPNIFTDAVKALLRKSNSDNNHVKHNSPKQGGSSLRPSGIQPDPNADYSVPL